MIPPRTAIVGVTRRLARVAALASLAVVLSSVVSGCGMLGHSPAAADPRPLGADDVRAVLTSMDASQSISGDYRVDALGFSTSIVSQLPVYLDSSDPSATPTTFLPPDTPSMRQLSPAQASDAVTRAVAVYQRVAKAQGSTAADAAMTSGGDAGGTLSAEDQGLLGLLQEGTSRLTFMFGQPDPTQWTWKIASVSITGTSTADVTYEVAAPAGKAFRFSIPTHTKHLHFSRNASGQWVLDGWLDYPSFESRIKGSVTPQTELPDLVPNWWDSLGADS